MASKKHDWTAIKRDHAAKRYANLRLLAEAHDVPYGYLKKKAAAWNKDENFISDVIGMDMQALEDAMPQDPEERMKLMYDKLSAVVYKALSNPQDSFFTENDTLKAKTLLDTATALEKIQKGYKEIETGKEDTGKLGQYADYIKQLRDNAKAIKESEK